MAPAAREDLLEALGQRFAANMHRHPGLDWGIVEARLGANPGAIATLAEMERTGGEPDVIGGGHPTGGLIFFDCSPESPAGRRSLCYDQAALDARKKDKPRGSAIEIAKAIGVEILTGVQYRHLQTLGAFDRTTSSWIATPPDIRGLGGALFCDRRYDHVFVYHNGAESYFAARGFRGSVTV